MATAAVIIASVAVGGSIYSSNKKRKAQRDAERVRQRSAKLQSSRQAIQSVRGAQIARAEIIQSGENQGVANSSAVLGGAGSVTSQSGSNISFANQIFSLQNQASRLEQSALLWQGRSNGFRQLGQLGVNIAGAPT